MYNPRLFILEEANERRRELVRQAQRERLIREISEDCQELPAGTADRSNGRRPGLLAWLAGFSRVRQAPCPSA